MAFSFSPAAGSQDYGGYTFGYITNAGVPTQAFLTRPGFLAPLPTDDEDFKDPEAPKETFHAHKKGSGSRRGRARSKSSPYI